MALAHTDSIWQRSGWERTPVPRLPARRRSAGATLWHVLLFALVTFAGYKAWQSRDLERDAAPAIGSAPSKSAPCRTADEAGQRPGVKEEPRPRC